MGNFFSGAITNSLLVLIPSVSLLLLLLWVYGRSGCRSCLVPLPCHRRLLLVDAVLSRRLALFFQPAGPQHRWGPLGGGWFLWCPVSRSGSSLDSPRAHGVLHTALTESCLATSLMSVTDKPSRISKRACVLGQLRRFTVARLVTSKSTAFADEPRPTPCAHG